MAPTQEGHGPKYRLSLPWFAGALAGRVVWLTVAGIVLLIPAFQGLGLHLLGASHGMIETLIRWTLYLQGLPALVLVIAFLPLLTAREKGQTVRLAWPGMLLAIGSMLCGALFLLAHYLPAQGLGFTMTAVVAGLLLESLACCLYCLAVKGLVLAEERAHPKEGRGWSRAFAIFRITTGLIGLLLAPILVQLVVPDFTGTLWEGGPRLGSLVAIGTLALGMVVTVWCIFSHPWVVVFCLRQMGDQVGRRGTTQAGATAVTEPVAPASGKVASIGWGRRLARMGPGVLLLGVILLGGARLFDLSEDPVISPVMAGPVTMLPNTVMVPAWEAAMPAGKSVIWCGSFQEAWQRLANEVNGEPIRLEGLEGPSAELNRWTTEGQAWKGARMLTEIGTVDNGVLVRIERSMRERFPNMPPPVGVPAEAKDVAVLFAYLDARLRFTLPYFDLMMDFPTVVPGRKEVVQGFGLPHDRWWSQERLRSQCLVLHAQEDVRNQRPGVPMRLAEFCVDLDGHSGELQVLVAKMPRPESPRAGWEWLVEKMDAYEKKGNAGRSIGMPDTLMVPAMHWDLTGRFLEGVPGGPKIVGGKLAGYRVGDATQKIRFRLDKSGVDLGASAKGEIYRSIPREFHCDGPFMVVMKNRLAKTPFLMVWVENEDLLEKGN